MNTIKYLFKDIRFWIILSFIIRLYGITNPPLEVAHNWRQTTVCMVARNFHEVDSNIFFPRIDFAGEKTGITGMEFPLLNYIVFLISKLFGYTHWYGRLINLIVSCIGIYYFFKITKKYFREDIAFNATIILVSSIWFSFARKIMPDTFSMSLLIIGIYYGTNYLDKSQKKIFSLSLYFIFSLLAILSKLPSAYLLIVFLIFILHKKIILPRKMIFILVSILFMIAPFLWYFYWVPYLVERYDFWHFFMGKSFYQGFLEISGDLPKTLEKFYDTAIKYIGFIAFIFGIIQAIRKKNRLLIAIFILGFIGFSVVIFKAGYTFSHHTYYIIPFVPIMSLLGGYGLSTIKLKKLVALLLILVAIEGILNQNQDFFINNNNKAILNLEHDLDKVSDKKDLILINSGNYPTAMYFAHRKGWIDHNQDIINSDYIDELKQKGLKYIVILKNTFGKDIELSYDLILQNEHYKIYKP